MALIPRLYLETTIFNYYFLKDISRRNDISNTKRLFTKVKKGVLEAYTSSIAIGEIEECPDTSLRERMLNLIKEFGVNLIEINNYPAYDELAQKYILAGAIPLKKKGDALHIAIATLAGMDIIVSWNCDHIVRFKTQQVVRTINLTGGFNDVAINTPSEVNLYD